MNPLNEFLDEYGTEKEAAIPGANSRFGHAVVGGVAAAGAGGVVAGLGMAATKAYDALTKGRDFKEMLSFNPDLQEHHDRDPRMFNQMYTSLRGINPQFGKDPLVAGTFMRRMVDAGGSAGGVLTSAVPARANSLVQDVSMLGAAAGANYYSDLNKSRARRDVDPNADMKSEFELHKMKHDLSSMPYDLHKKKQEASDPLRALRLENERGGHEEDIADRARRQAGTSFNAVTGEYEQPSRGPRRR